ncbi:MAG: 4-phosphoerythronate dehydrogenase [Alcanivorax sp.]|nr:4-phosphoerythronate dehydrogenase [Alcanivorax sp.]
MQMIADANMPGLEAFAHHGQLTTVDGRKLSRQQLGNAEVLLVRSVSRVDQALLQGSRVRFVGSATIGTDHVDLDYLQEAGIHFAHAPGCNARAVSEYVLQAVLTLCQHQGRPARGARVAVVGLGNVGARVADWLSALGMTVQVCDPPLQDAGYQGPWPLHSLDALLDADVITLHVPLTRDGPHPTRHLLNAERLARLGPQQMLINTCRGPVVDNDALLDRLLAGRGPATVLDVWEREPQVSSALLEKVVRGSPHIAGYSLEGKLAGTAMLYQAFCQWQGLECASTRGGGEPPPLMQPVNGESDILALVQYAYRLQDDHQRLTASLRESNPAAAFDALRKHYPLRHELHHWRHQGAVAAPWQPLVSRLFSVNR